MLSTFNAVVKDFGAQIKRVNEKFGTEFLHFEHTDENVKRSFQLVEEMHRNHDGKNNIIETRIPRPSIQRNNQNKELKKAIRQKPNQALLNRANILFSRYINE